MCGQPRQFIPGRRAERPVLRQPIDQIQCCHRAFERLTAIRKLGQPGTRRPRKLFDIARSLSAVIPWAGTRIEPTKDVSAARLARCLTLRGIYILLHVHELLQRCRMIGARSILAWVAFEEKALAFRLSDGALIAQGIHRLDSLFIRP